MGDQVESFGRKVEEEPAEPPKVPVPLIPVALAATWDPESLKAIGDQVREVVAAAVVEGLAEGARRGEQLQSKPGVPLREVRYRYNPQPDLHHNDRFAFQKYAEELDRDFPGWHTDPTDFMHPELAAEANKRRRRHAPVDRG